MTEQSDSAKIKAELINNNKIYIPENIKLPYPFDRSTAGPGSGSLSIALSFNKKNIKLTISQDQNVSFSLQKENDDFHILKDGEIFLEDVEILPISFHAPGQIFLNLEDRCIYKCAFCSLPQKGFLNEFNKERFAKLILKMLNRDNFQAVALTGGVYPDNTEIINKMCYIVQKIKEKLPTIPIGVEPCILNEKEILNLKTAGADEIKINLQIPDEKLFDKICPDFSYDNLYKMLKEAVEIFGKGNVASNIIYGLGESDRIVIETIERLAKIGVVPTLRKIRINKLNRTKLEEAMSCEIPSTSSDRIINLAYEQKKILEKFNLSTKTFKTMCHKCGCCDIVPFWDL